MRSLAPDVRCRQALTARRLIPNIVPSMATTRARTQNDDLKVLESRVDELIERVRRLQQENQSLRSRHDVLSEKHVKLAEKTRIARERIESMIGRLKALERT